MLEFSGNVIVLVEFKSVGGELGAVFSIEYSDEISDAERERL
jgi:hypothetical protein